jgi:hypothetical protein
MNATRIALVAMSFVALTLSACGGGSTKEDPVALCKQGCDKAISLCAVDAGIPTATLKMICETSCATSTPTGTTCKNSSAIIAAYKVCQSKTTCDEYTACGESIPACEGGGSGGSSGTGTGGSSGAGTGGRSGTGTGGSSGTGTGGSSGTGTGGSSGGTACADLLACCNKSTVAQIKDGCTAQLAGAMTDEATCAQVLAGYRSVICP